MLPEDTVYRLPRERDGEQPVSNYFKRYSYKLLRGLENVTEASIDIVVSVKWGKSFCVNYPFKLYRSHGTFNPSPNSV